MNKSVLEKDSDLLFPHFTVLKASAGSGKTYALSHRFVQYLLSERIPKNRLRNIVAMTFSNNAAKEMRERILLWLKLLSHGDEATLERFSCLVSIAADDLKIKAESVLREILEQYSDFQVKTIDSFMTTVFKASAVDFGYHPEFDILLDNSLTMKYAFQLFLRRVAEGTGEAAMIEAMVGLIAGQKRSEAAYLWDPSSNLLEEIGQMARIATARGKKLVIPDAAGALEICGSSIRKCVEEIEGIIRESGLEVSGNSAYAKSDIPSIARDRRFSDLVGKRLAAKPVNKPGKKEPSLAAAFEAVLDEWGRLGGLVREYTLLHAISFYYPYLTVFEAFNQTIEDVKRKQGVIFIEDINRCLASYLDLHIVPDIYFRLGETINHFFIDEFQDTSPIQWKNLYPLLENALSERGSVFVVGDTKQAIYGFRDADYKIMKDAENGNPFVSAAYSVRELVTNFRSCPEILAYNECVFKKDLAANEEYRNAACESGLNEYVQHADPNCGVPGHVELHCVTRGDDERAEKEKLLEIIQSLQARQYRYGDIAILTQRNEEAVKITSWLNDRNIPFLSFSSLDIRLRKLTIEIVALLRFLDSPTDDFSFATFILGDIFSRTLSGPSEGTMGKPDFHAFLFQVRQQRPLYKVFQEKYAALWDRYFSRLFRSAGYFPLYDLVTQAYHVFGLFEVFAEEEATLIKLLETVKDFEGRGFNSLGDFLDFAESEEAAAAEWHMNVPTTQDAVRVMTIHKAKGLGFPVAIVMLFEYRPQGLGYIVKDDKDTFSILKITKDMAQLDEGLGELYGAAVKKEIVNSLNSLYVGFTRPEEELYVVGVTPRPEQPGYPLSLLPFSRYQYFDRPVRSAPEETGERNETRLVHRHSEIVFPATSGGVFSLEEKRRGDRIHAVLAAIHYIDEDPETAIGQAATQLASTQSAEHVADVRRTLEGFIGMPQIAACFKRKPGRSVWNEKELADEGGRLFRIDRLVVDAEEVIVLDYKTGLNEDAGEYHISQMHNYLGIVRGVYSDRPVSGIIAYVDLQKVRRIA